MTSKPNDSWRASKSLIKKSLIATCSVFVLAAAAPVAFHIVTLSRVFGLRSDLVRLLVVTSTVVGGALLVAGIALTR